MDPYSAWKRQIAKVELETGRAFARDAPWPNIFKSRRCGVWQLRFPDGTASNFHIRRYDAFDDAKEFVMRISDDLGGYMEKQNIYYVAATKKPRFEMNYLVSERDKVHHWLFENYLSVMTIPDWLLDYSPKELWELGEPLCMKLNTNAAEKYYQEGIKRREEIRAQNRKENHNRP
jgi:hypothetical protein